MTGGDPSIPNPPGGVTLVAQSSGGYFSYQEKYRYQAVVQDLLSGQPAQSRGRLREHQAVTEDRIANEDQRPS
jgi:hypothetical protein